MEELLTFYITNIKINVNGIKCYKVQSEEFFQVERGIDNLF